MATTNDAEIVKRLESMQAKKPVTITEKPKPTNSDAASLLTKLAALVRKYNGKEN